MTKRKGAPAVKPPTRGPQGPAGDSGATEAHSRSEIELGDNVYVGEPHPDKVHWIVERIPPSARVLPTYPSVRLSSPMSNRTRLACLSELRLHSRGTPPKQENRRDSDG